MRYPTKKKVAENPLMRDRLTVMAIPKIIVFMNFFNGLQQFIGKFNTTKQHDIKVANFGL